MPMGEDELNNEISWHQQISLAKQISAPQGEFS